MQAIQLTNPGGPDNLRYIEIDKPVIQHGEVLIQSRAISINPVDAKTRKGIGAYPKIKEDNPVIIGWDVAGIVSETRSDQFRVGDEVFGMVNFPGHGRAYAEYVAAPADQLALKPGHISFEEAAAATLAALTAFQNLVHHGNVQKGDRVLIHAASGGVGHYAVQIGKSYGAYVIGTSSSANRDFVLALGADEHIDYKATAFQDAVRDIDIVLDPMGGETALLSLEVLKPGGRMLSITAGLKEEDKPKAMERKIDAQKTMVHSSGEDMKMIAELLGSGAVKSHVSKVFRFGEIREAHELVETARTIGKIVLVV